MNRITASTSGKNTGALVGTALAVMSLAGAACAQSAPAATKGSFERPMTKRTRVAAAPHAAQATQPAGGGHRQVNISRSDDDGTCTVTVDGDDIEATIDGEEVPADRIQHEDGVVRLLDEHGKVVAEFHVSGDDDRTVWLSGGEGGGAAGGAGGAFMQPLQGQAIGGDPVRGFAWVDNPPPVMLGITMGEPSETLLDHLGLEAGSAVLIDKVYEGLPADEGGMKDEDILVEFDGAKPLTEAKVREILRTKSAGDEVKVRVVRKGATKDLKIKLQAYDASKLGSTFSGQGEALAPQDVQGLYGAWGGNEEAHKALEHALKSLGSMHGADADAVRDTARQALEQALKSLDESRTTLGFRYAPRALSGSGGSVVVGPGPGQVYSLPPQPAVPSPYGGRNGDLSRQMDELRAQLDEVQRSRDELRAQLDDIKAMLKEMRDHDRR